MTRGWRTSLLSPTGKVEDVKVIRLLIRTPVSVPLRLFRNDEVECQFTREHYGMEKVKTHRFKVIYSVLI